MEMKLFYSGEISGMSESQVKEAETFIQGLVYGIIATNCSETGPRLSGLNNLEGQTLRTLHFCTDSTSQKVTNIAANPRCEIMYATMEGGQIMVSGTAEIVNDTELKRTLWQDWMNEYSPEGPSDTGMCIIRFTPASIRAMLS